MTEVRYSEQGEARELLIDGHAGYSDRGNDIVCAGVSAIGYSLLGYLLNRQDLFTNYEVASGRLRIHSKVDERAAAAFDMAVIGLKQIAKQYHDNVIIHTSAIGGDSRE